MDLSKIFLKDACPTSIGGQAIMDGIMMRGPKRTAIAIRLPNGKIHMKTQPTPKASKWAQIPFVRGVVNFIGSLVMGTKVLMYSAEVLEANDPEDYEKDKFDLWVEKKFGKEKAWDIILTVSVVISVLLAVGVFILLPTVVVGWFGALTDSVILLNLIEGLFRIVMFVVYVWAISKMKEIHVVFQYHGAEHKTIHCFENGLELTPENAQTFYTLHPRCGTSFLVIVLLIAIIVHAFMGWPGVAVRILSRLAVLPVIAGISYEILKLAGRSDSTAIKVMSLPGIYLQKLTTRVPEADQLEVAIAAIKAVIPGTEEQEAGTPYFMGICDKDGRPVEGEVEYYDPEALPKGPEVKKVV